MLSFWLISSYKLYLYTLFACQHRSMVIVLCRYLLNLRKEKVTNKKYKYTIILIYICTFTGVLYSCRFICFLACLMSHNFVLKTGHFKQCNMAFLEIKFSSLPRACHCFFRLIFFIELKLYCV